jgi:transposase
LPNPNHFRIFAIRLLMRRVYAVLARESPPSSFPFIGRMSVDSRKSLTGLSPLGFEHDHLTTSKAVTRSVGDSSAPKSVFTTDAEVTREEETSRYQVERAFRFGAEGALARACERSQPKRLALDEAAHRRGSQALATIVCDLDRRRVLDVVDGRDRRTIERYLRSRPAEQRRALETISIDPYEAYRQAVRAALPAVRIVVDPFHLVRGRQQRARLGAARAAVLRPQPAAHRRPADARRRLARRTLPRPPPSAQGARAAHRARAAQALRAVRERAADRRGMGAEGSLPCHLPRTRPRRRRRLELFLAGVDRAAIPSFTAFAKGLRSWREELRAYFDQPTTNGYAEGMINKIKTIKRRAHGLPNFAGFRQRVVVACG